MASVRAAHAVTASADMLWAAGCSRRFAVLSHSWAPGSAPSPADGGPGRVCIMLHGILGSKANWRAAGRLLLQEAAAAEPSPPPMPGPQLSSSLLPTAKSSSSRGSWGPASGWQVLLLTHRGHAESPSGKAPHTLASCAEDVLETLEAVGVCVGRDELVVCGHSFGGKVALALRNKLVDIGTPPSMTWVLDSVPGHAARLSDKQLRSAQHPFFVLPVVERAAGLGVFSSRGDLAQWLQENGLRRGVALWIAQSVRHVPGGVELAYDLEVVRALIEDHRAQDLWPAVESGGAGPYRAPVGLVVAGRDAHWWGEDNFKRLHRDDPTRRSFEVAVLDGVGHNLHVDDLPGLIRILTPSLSRYL